MLTEEFYSVDLPSIGAPKLDESRLVSGMDDLLPEERTRGKKADLSETILMTFYSTRPIRWNIRRIPSPSLPQSPSTFNTTIVINWIKN